MLVNVCACKWSRVHPRCLESLQRVNLTCGVCKEVFTHSTEMRSFTALLWEQKPCASYVQVFGGGLLLAMGFFTFGLGALLMTCRSIDSSDLSERPGYCAMSTSLDMPFLAMGTFLAFYGIFSLRPLLIEGCAILPVPTAIRSAVAAMRHVAARVASFGRRFRRRCRLSCTVIAPTPMDPPSEPSLGDGGESALQPAQPNLPPLPLPRGPPGQQVV